MYDPKNLHIKITEENGDIVFNDHIDLYPKIEPPRIGKVLVEDKDYYESQLKSLITTYKLGE